MMHGVATNIEGPYTWTSEPNLGSNPAAVTFTDPATGKTQYALFFAGSIHISDSVNGPWAAAGPSPGGNPAPIYLNGTWFATSQSTRQIVTAAKLGDKWTKFADIEPHLDHGTQEDPFMFIDKRGNWHIINHGE